MFGGVLFGEVGRSLGDGDIDGVVWLLVDDELCSSVMGADRA